MANSRIGMTLKSVSRFGSAKQSVKKTKRLTEEEIQNQIRERAYYLYEARKGGSGSSESDWAEAERQIRAEN